VWCDAETHSVSETGEGQVSAAAIGADTIPRARHPLSATQAAGKK
jgi:hypothetical protein